MTRENKKLILRHAIIEGDKVTHEQVAIEYGTLITQLLNFFIIALCVFVVVKMANQLRVKAQDTSNKKVVKPKDIQLLTDLKGIMKEQNEILKELRNKA